MTTIGNAPVFPTQSVLPGNLTVTGNATISGTTNSVGNLTENSNNVVNVADTGTITAGMLNGGQTGSAPAFIARAWIHMNGTGTIAINSSGNIASITDLGTGYYRATFTTAMSTTSYSVVGVAKYQGWYGDFRLQLIATTKIEFYTGRSESLNASDENGIFFVVYE